MIICSNGHDEVAFASSWAQDCPACSYANEVREAMQEQIDDLNEKLEANEDEQS